MSLARSKRGIELSTFGEMILIIAVVGVLLTVFNVATLNAEEKTAENLCRTFNALRFHTEIKTPLGDRNVAPRACKTIDKDDIPSKDYKTSGVSSQEAAKAEIRDLMTKCWGMWLEGNQQNMFDKGVYDFSEKCFVCYTFSVDRSAGNIPYNNFIQSLDEPYYALDITDKCAPAGQGGKCRDSCNPNSDYFSREVSSNKCGENKKCCIAEDSRDECKNKGGMCLPSPNSEYTKFYPKWQCRSGGCYIKPENIASYLDYFQGTGGVENGEGKVLFGDNEGFHSGAKYSITLVSPGKEWGINELLKLGGATTLSTVTAVGLATIGLISAPVAIAGAVVAAAAEYLVSRNSGTITDINYIMLSNYNTVKDRCAVQSGGRE